MASTYSTNLGIELPGTGDQAGVWGNTTNTNLGTLIEQAISGYVTQAVATGTDTTITIPNGATGVARNMYLELTGTGGASTNLIVPANKKLYFIFNNTSSGQVTVKVSGQTGISVPNGKKMILVSNGTDIVTAENYVASLSTDNLSLTGNLTLSAGTANGVLYLNGSKVATSGSALTFDGTSFVAGVSAGAGQHIFRTYTSGGFAAIYNGAVTPGSTNYSFVTSATQTTLNAATFVSAEVGGNEGMRLTSTGLGIGTSSPGFKLDVNGISAVRAGNAIRYYRADNAIYTQLYDAGSSGFTLDNVNGNGFRFQSNGTNQAVIDSSGNLGIGTSSPAQKLHVASAGNNYIVSSNTAGSTSALLLGSESGQNTIYSWTTVAGSTGRPLAFYTGASESMRLDSSGNLGIGTASPGVRLDVRSATGYQINTTVTDATSAGGIRTFNSAGVGFAALTYGPSYSGGSLGSVGPNGLALVQTGNAPLMLTTDIGISQPLLFGTNGLERMRLDSSGNLGLGVTPSAWAGGVSGLGLQVGAYTSIASANAFGAGYGFNFYYDGTNYRYVASNYASLIEQSGGAFRFKTAASGTAGNAISFTQAMTLDASGNLGVGTTSPDSRLQVTFDNAETSQFNAGAAVMHLTNTNTTTNNWAQIFWTDSDNGAAVAAFGVQYTDHTNDYGALAFSTRGSTGLAERARITSGGELIIGTTAAAASERLRVRGAGNTSATYNCIFENSDGTLVFNFENAGKFRTGTLADSPYNYIVGGTNRDLYVDSTGYIGYVSSTRESKSNIVSIKNVSWLLNLNPVSFNRRKRNEDREFTNEIYDETEYGLIAEEVESVNPELCFYDDADSGGKLRGVTYSKLITPMLKLLQEQQAMINELKAEVAALKGA